MTPASTYARFAPYVRQRLAALGVHEADLPDLCHEVFLIVHGKRRALSDVERVDLWLREICRRVAAGYRRRAGHRLEILGCDVHETAAPVCDAPDGDQMHVQIRRALNHLDDESRDLLALHDGGEMPLRALANLVAHDRKTVRRRLTRARRLMSTWLADSIASRPGAAVRTTPAASPFMREMAARGRSAGCSVGELEILRVSPEHCSGAIGNVVISDWRGPQVGAATIDALISQAPFTLEMCGGQIAYLALIEPTMAPPTLEVRQKIVDVFEMVGPYFNAFAAAVLGDSAQINQPILEGLTLLARPRFPMRFFSSVRAAAEWLCGAAARVATGPLTSCNLVAAAAHLQQLEPDRQDGRRRARSMPIARA